MVPPRSNPEPTVAALTLSAESLSTMVSPSPSEIGGFSLFCNQCGGRIADGSVFCNLCGAELGVVPAGGQPGTPHGPAPGRAPTGQPYNPSAPVPAAARPPFPHNLQCSSFVGPLQP